MLEEPIGEDALEKGNACRAGVLRLARTFASYATSL